MALKALPLLYINLGGEMMYILDQRLKAQNISQDKSDKVVHDIVGTMFSQKFVEELFKPQELYSRKALRTIFEKLAHASIMRLNAGSMDKLYDLMNMVFKYQVYMCPSPPDLLLITLNHLDAIKHMVMTNEDVLAQVSFVYSLLIKHYSTMPIGEYQLIRYTLLGYFQDLRIRVSIFLKDGCQTPNGVFVIPTAGPVPFGFQVPGIIREFGPGGHITKETKFYPGGDYTPPLPPGTLEPDGHRGTTLGKNIYFCITRTEKEVKKVEAQNHMESPIRHAEQTVQNDYASYDSHALEEMTLLARLIGQSLDDNAASQQKPQFTLNLFANADEYMEYSSSNAYDGLSQGILSIDFKKAQPSHELSRIMDDMTLQKAEEGGESDILELLDQAAE